MISKKSRSEIRRKKHLKLRNRFSGATQRPRLAVFRSNNHMYAQIIDDTVGNTLVSASTLQKEVKAELEKTNDVNAAAYLGKVIAGHGACPLVSYRALCAITAQDQCLFGGDEMIRQDWPTGRPGQLCIP